MSLPLTHLYERFTGATTTTTTSRLWKIRVGLAILVLVLLRWGLKKAKQQVRFVLPSEPHPQLKKGLRLINLEEYYVPNLFRSSWMQLGWLIARWRTQTVLEPTRREAITLRHSGGDQVLLDWFYPEKRLNSKTAILVYIPGITGRLPEAVPFVERVREKGWIAVVFHRRGHEAPLKRPTFNIFGSALDLRVAVECIEKAEPDVPIALVGSSAGSAVMVRYLGQYANDPKVVAGIGLSPGYSINEVWQEITGTFFDRYILASVKRFFVDRNRELLLKRNAQALYKLESASSVHEFAQIAAAFSAEHHDDSQEALEHTFEEWLDQTCPMVFVRNISTPTICVNSLDDPVCTRRLVEEVGVKLADNNAYGAMVLTEYGSHCAHQSFHKGFPPENWGHTVALNFVEGVINE